MEFDHSSPVVALCIAGMQVEGDTAQARALFEQAWAARRDDLDASLAAHYLARHQPDAVAALHWNALALSHAERVQGIDCAALMPSLCLNLGDSYLTAGRLADARRLVQRGLGALEALRADGYGALISGGLTRLATRIATAEQSALNGRRHR